jgi:hypothetical protein
MRLHFTIFACVLQYCDAYRQFHQRFNACFRTKFLVPKFQTPIQLCIFWRQKLQSREFHQRFMREFFLQKFVQSQTLSREKTFKQKMRA